MTASVRGSVEQVTAGEGSRDLGDKLYDEDEIARRVEELAGEIARAVSGDFAIVALLKGSFVFVADLLRELARRGLAPTVEFMRVSSYGRAKESSGTVRLLGEVPAEVAGRTGPAGR